VERRGEERRREGKRRDEKKKGIKKQWRRRGQDERSEFFHGSASFIIFRGLRIGLGSVRYDEEAIKSDRWSAEQFHTGLRCP
jgi:hypothetical protein